MTHPTISILTPAYRSAGFVGETLASIQAQTFTDFRVLISVDGADVETEQVCRPFLADERFEMFLQPGRLGWARNINYLLGRVVTPLFIYWQHDDTCDPTYLQRLNERLSQKPEAIVAYTDLQAFEKVAISCMQPSLRGFALERLLSHLEEFRWIAFRGLIRSECLARVGSLRVTEHDSAHEDVVWLAKLAREGEFSRVPEILYFKRFHQASTHLRWFAWSIERQRVMWLEVALGLVEAGLPLLPRADDQTRYLVAVAQRILSRPAPGRPSYAAPDRDAKVRFVKELIQASRERYGVTPPASIRLPKDPAEGTP